MFVERFQSPVIKDQKLDVAKSALQSGIATIAMSQSEIGKQPRNALIENRPIVPACFVTPGQPAFANARMAADGEIVVRVVPVSSDELHEERPIKSTLTA